MSAHTKQLRLQLLSKAPKSSLPVTFQSTYGYELKKCSFVIKIAKNKLQFCQTPVFAVQAMHTHGNSLYRSSSYLCTQGHVITSTLIFLPSKTQQRGFGGLEVACWPLVPKFAGSNPAEAVRFLRVNKNPQHVGGHGCLSVVIVVCCQVEVSATN